MSNPKQKVNLPTLIIIGLAFSAFAAYFAFGMPPAPGEMKQVAIGAAIFAGTWFEVWRQHSQTSAPDDD